MSFDVAADAYDRFMGRYATPLAAAFVALLEVGPGDRVLDVGCGPGALTTELARLLGPERVAAVDPSASFVAATAARLPGVDVRRAAADRLPFGTDAFDATAAQLVVHFLPDPVAGLAEMARVTRPGGVVAASVWDHAGGGGPLTVFWQAVAALDPEAHDESGLAGAREGHLGELLAAAGLREVGSGSLTVRVRHETVEQWWEPFTLGVGPAGAYLTAASRERRAEVRAACLALLPPPPFELEATAWTAWGRVG